MYYSGNMLQAILDRLTPLRICVLLGLGAVLLYWPAVHHGFIDVDDPGFITANALIQMPPPAGIIGAFTGTTMLLYLPLTLISYQINFLTGGLHPSVYHLTDILLHAANTVLVALIILRLLRSRLAAILCALLFLAHPIQTEAVLWASSRKDLLSSFFSLFSLLYYLRYLQENDERSRWYAIGLYLAALLSKIAVFPLPILFILLDLREGWSWRISLREKIPYAVIAIPLLLIAVVAGNQFALALTPWEVLLLGAKNVTFLLWQIAWPEHLSLLHLQRSPVTIADPVFMLSLTVFTIVCAGAWLLWKRSIMLPALGLLFFVVMLMPTFLAAQKGGMLFFTSDKYAYLPMLGLLISLAVFLRWLEERWQSVLAPVTVLMIFLSGLLAVHTRTAMSAWASAETIQRRVLAEDHTNPVALSNLGLLLQDEKPEEALQAFQAAMSADPHYAIPYFNAAALLRKRGREADAITTWENMIPMLTAREIRGDRSLQRALVWLEGRFTELGRPDLAEKLNARVLELVPNGVSN